MSIKPKRRAWVSAIFLSMATWVATPALAQNEQDSELDAATGNAAPTPPIVTDPDLRRLEERRRRVEVLSGLFERQTRVFRISYRLLYAAVDMCPTRARPAVGFTYANAYMFQGAVRTAATALGYTHRISVVDVAANSAAERAGVRQRDELIAIDGWPVPYGEGAVTLTQAKLRDVLVRDSGTVLTLRRGAGNFSVSIEPDYLCEIQVLAVPGDSIRAYADGDKVVVFEGLHAAVDDDDVLAAAIAREIANNLIPNLDIDADEGIEWSSFFDWGLEPEPSGDVLADQSLAQDYGNAADYVGAYLMARAGFDHRKAPDLWYQMANRERTAPQHSYGVPGPDYLLGLEQTVDEINRKLAARAPLRPEQGGPPTALAAAPEPTGPPAPTPSATPEAVAVAQAEQPTSKVPQVPQVAITDLPWLEPTPEATGDSMVQTANTETVSPETEIEDLPWIVASQDANAEAVAPDAGPAEIVVSTLDTAPADTANRSALLPDSEIPGAAMAALGMDAPKPAIVAEAAMDVPTAAAERRVVSPATGEAEIAVLFRNRTPPQPTDETPEKLAVETEELELAELPEIVVAPEPTTTPVPEQPLQGENDEFDIGDLIRELESADDVAAPKLGVPEIAEPEVAELPWLSETPDAPEQAPDPGVIIAVGPLLKIDRDDLAPPPELTVTAVDPGAAPEPMILAPSNEPVLAPDQVAAPIEALPAAVAKPFADGAPPDEKLVSAGQTDAADASIESTFDLIAPAASPPPPGADPKALGKGFSFRAWLGEG